MVRCRFICIYTLYIYLLKVLLAADLWDEDVDLGHRTPLLVRLDGMIDPGPLYTLHEYSTRAAGNTAKYLVV